MKRKVVIWGDDHHNALGLLRMLGNSGFDTLFLVHARKKDVATASKYCGKYVVVPSIETGLSFLMENYSDRDNKAVLIFTADKYSEAANNYLDRLKDFFFVSGPSQPGLLATIDDKYSMSMMAAECGITIPDTILFPETPISSVRSFPAIIKPCSPANKDFKTIIVKNNHQLQKLSKRLKPQKRYIIQSFIHKDADGLVYGCRTWNGETHLAGICVRNRWGDDKCGSFGYITSVIPTSISISGIESFLERIDFRGLFSVEYAITEDKAYFYEFNLRNDGTSVLFYNAGSNLALTFVNSCFGIKEAVPIKVNGKQYLMHEILDRFNIYDGNVTKRQWLEDKSKVTLHFLYDPDDMKPYEVQKAQETKLFIHHIIANTWINKVRLRIKRIVER